MSGLGEEWRPVAEWPYEVSSLGRVRRAGATPIRRTSVSDDGYESVIMCAGRRKTHKSVHRLVCIAFHGEPPTPSHEVDHRNKRRADNRAENLRWLTKLENMAHCAHRRGESHPRARFTDSDIRLIRASNASPAALAESYGVVAGTIHHIRARATWKHVK